MIALVVRLLVGAGLTVLAVAIAGNAWRRADETPGPSPRPVATPAPATDAGKQRAPDVVRPALSQFEQTTARPLFFESRRQPQPAVRAAAPDAPAATITPAVTGDAGTALAGYRLVGIVLAGAMQRAVVAAEKSTTVSVGVGDRLGEWEIIAIDRNSVGLRRTGQAATLRLYSGSTEN